MSFRFFTRSAIAVTGLFLATGCGSSSEDYNDPNLISFNNYEAVLGWTPDPSTISKEQAHSGRYSVRVDSEHEFGMGYGLPLGKATMRKPRKIRISAWAYMTDANSIARLGLQIMDPVAGKGLAGDGIDFKDAIKDYRKWVEISKEITMPENVASTNELRVFLWRGMATSPAYIDDLRISLIE